MSANGYLQLILYLVVLLALAKPLGTYMARIYEGQPAVLNRVGAPFERLIYRLCGVDPAREMRWTHYALAMLAFNLLGGLAVYGLQRLQAYLPLNPQAFPAVSPDSSFNTAASFITNTNWQGYGGESTMSYLTQMAALSVQNFVSAATGMAILLPLIRAFARQKVDTVGNFWVDLTRSTLYILLPLSLIFALVLVSQGVVQTFSGYPTVPLVESVEYDNPKLDAAGQPVKDDKGNPVTEKATQKEQVIAVGPAASQIAIKQLGTNGGGFFNVNSAHPFENPTPLSNFLEVLAILLISGGAVLHVRQDGRRHASRLGHSRCDDAGIRRAAGACASGAEQAGNPALDKLGVDQTPERAAGGRQHGRQGDPLRHRQLRSVGNGHDRGVQRLGQRDARLVHADRRPRPDVADPTGRGDLRRRGLRPVRDADLRHRSGVRRRLDDRAHAGVPGQEDRGVRDEDGRDRGPDPAGDGARRHRHCRRRRCRQGRRRQPGRAWFLRDPVRVLLCQQQQWQRVRGPVRQHAVLQHGVGHMRCCSHATGWPSRCWRLPARW